MAVRTTTLTIYGARVTGIAVPCSESQLFDLTMQDPVTRSALDLTGATATLTVWTLDQFGNPLAVAVTLTGTPVLPLSGGHAQFRFTTPAAPGSYGFDVRFSDVASNQFYACPFSPLTLTPA